MPVATIDCLLLAIIPIIIIAELSILLYIHCTKRKMVSELPSISPKSAMPRAKSRKTNWRR